MQFGDFVPDGLGRLIYSGVGGAYILDAQFSFGQATGSGRWLWNNGRVLKGNFLKYVLQDDDQKEEEVFRVLTDSQGTFESQRMSQPTINSKKFYYLPNRKKSATAVQPSAHAKSNPPEEGADSGLDATSEMKATLFTQLQRKKTMRLIEIE